MFVPYVQLHSNISFGAVMGRLGNVALSAPSLPWEPTLERTGDRTARWFIHCRCVFYS